MGDLGVGTEEDRPWFAGPLSNPDPDGIGVETWVESEETGREVLNCVYPTFDSDEKRKDVIEFIQRLIRFHLRLETHTNVFEEPLIVEAELEGYLVRKVYVDEGLFVKVMFEHYFENLNPRIKAKLRETQTDLVGFAEKISKSLGKIELEVCFGNEGLCRRTSMKRLEKKQMIKESSEWEREVAAMEEVLVNPLFPDQRVTIGGRLSETYREQLECLLKDNMRVFTWESSNMACVPCHIIEHTLNVNPSMDLVCQKQRTFSTKKSRVVTNEVSKWVKAGIVRPVRKSEKYAVELRAYNITFIPRNAVKGQVLVDFLSKEPEREREGPKGSGACLVLIGPSGVEYTYSLCLTFPSTNNEAEYEAILAGLRIARQMTKAREHASAFKSFLIKNVPRNMNQKAHVLCKLASMAFNHLTKEVLVEVLHERSTKSQEVRIVVEEEGDNWMTPILWCLEEGIWLKDKNEVRCLRAKIGQYAMESRILFKKGYLIPMLRFGLPWIIVTDNKMQLVNDPFKSWCGRFEIHQMNTAVGAPPSKRTGRKGQQEFDGREAVIPAEIGILTYRTLMVREEYNEEEMRLNLDLLQERRETAAIREEKHKTKMEQNCNKKVRPSRFRPGEFVFRRNEASRVEDQGKLGPKWEGPYKVVEAYRNGSYELETLEDKEATTLKKQRVRELCRKRVCLEDLV
nr:reverse transcriptase domain-containing protein [Tanacetum cinerariifolium]